MAFEQFWGYDTKQEMFQGSVEDQILQNLKYLNAIHSNNSNNSKQEAFETLFGTRKSNYEQHFLGKSISTQNMQQHILNQNAKILPLKDIKQSRKMHQSSNKNIYRGFVKKTYFNGSSSAQSKSAQKQELREKPDLAGCIDIVGKSKFKRASMVNVVTETLDQTVDNDESHIRS